MVLRLLLYLIIILSLSQKIVAQVNSDTINTDIRYEPVKEDYFKKYKKAKLIVEYYFTDGWSNLDRYSYEIIIIDSLLMLAFESPKTDSYEPVSFQKKTVLTNSQLDSLKKRLINSSLKQSKIGIPNPTFSAYTKEVLIVKYKNINVAGGLAYGNIASYPDSESKKDIDQEISDDRKQSSSIRGEYDMIINFLKRCFPELDKLKKKSLPK